MSERAGVVVVEDGRVALIERHRRGMRYYVFPGGGVDEGEDPKDAAVREAREELGVDVALEGEQVVVAWPPRVHRYWRARIVGGAFGSGTGPEYGPYDEAKGTYEAVWLPVAELGIVRTLPRMLARFVVTAERDGWPDEPVQLIEPVWSDDLAVVRYADQLEQVVADIVAAESGDIPAWLALAAEVDDLFGDRMSVSEQFRATLHRNIARESAYCVREQNGPVGRPLAAAMLWSPARSQIGWLAVAERWRLRGLARALVTHAIGLAPEQVSVVTFTAEMPGSLPARLLYETMGFRPGETIETPFGRRQRFVRRPG